jgi:hypothetical protein
MWLEHDVGAAPDQSAILQHSEIGRGDVHSQGAIRAAQRAENKRKTGDTQQSEHNLRERPEHCVNSESEAPGRPGNVHIAPQLIRPRNQPRTPLLPIVQFVALQRVIHRRFFSPGKQSTTCG